MMNVKVLIIVADPSTQRSLVRALSKANFQIHRAACDSAIETIEREQPDILLIEHADLCAHIRQYKPRLPMIALLVSTQQQRISQVLDEGADDCIVQPFDPGELQARIRAHVRRSRPEGVLNEIVSEDGYIRMSIPRHTVSVGGQPISLSKIEFALLRELMTHAEKVVSYRHLLQRVWGDEYREEYEYVRIYVNKLRGKIEPNPSRPRYLLTEVRVGYVFRSPLVVASSADSQRCASL